MNKQWFDDAMGEVPPSTVDVDAVVTRQRRAAWARRVAVPAVAVSGVVAVTVGVAVAVAPNETGQTGVAVRPTSTEQVGPPPCGDGDTPTVPEGAEQRIATVFRDAVAEHLPYVALAEPDAEHRSSVPAGEPTCDRVKQMTAVFADYANVVIDLPCSSSDSLSCSFSPDVGPQVGLDIARLGGWNYVDTEFHRPECEHSTGPEGEAITECGWPAEQEYSVSVVKPDGTGLVVSSSPTLANEQARLNLDQLREIALDPELTLTP